MPIVSEHPRSLEIIQRLSDECNTELEEFIREYTERRRKYQASTAAHQGLIRKLEDEERAELSWQELAAILMEREAAAEELRDEMEIMGRELMLLKREIRRTRRKLESAVGAEIQWIDPRAGSAERLDARASAGQLQRVSLLGWLKPWLRGFLPSSA